ncbi:lysylphosphatidylglycerol synthase transmembrane domain-containing protein [Amycolatopsis antarctica]|uniref:lysylphosphatidylglycerol synthase transmembrane domain-containing protein n=1 Tax=Amycolatopsis antarctica TaxID=1854586 RepID=UPI001F0A0D1E|nr:lysylphosphatidylglycerol synthase transmembrane domain-containing protein [Amycolatopsis antarctica]
MKAPKTTKAKILDVVRWVAIVLVVVLAVRELSRNWDQFWETLQGIAWQSSLLSLLALVASIAVSVYGWQVMVDHLGKPIGYARGAQINLVGSLGKYIPGSVWGYLLQMELGRKAGLARARIFTASLVQLGVGIAAAFVLSLLAMRQVFANSGYAPWLLVLIPISLVALYPRVLTWGTSLVLKLLRRKPLQEPLSWQTVGKVFGSSLGAWSLQGVHLWLLANSVGAPGFGGLIICVGAMAIAMNAGTFAFILPSGAGVREGVQVLVLTATGIEAGQALAIAIASRVMFTVADLITAGGAAVTARLRHGPPTPAPAAK